MNMMRLINLIYPRNNRRFMAGWVKGRITLASYCTATPPRSCLEVNRKAAASYCRPTQILTLDRKTREGLDVLKESQGFANSVLIFHKGLEEHVAVSPTSFHVILSLLAAGSGGWSHRHFLDFFEVESVDQINASVSLLNNVILAHHDDDDSSLGTRIHSSTSLWHHHSLSLDPLFLRSLHKAHRASLFPVNFHKTSLARQQINSKVEHDTRGLIKDLISEESLSNSVSVKLVFTNTLHFKGDWDINDDMQNRNNCLRYDPHWSQEYDYFFPKKFMGAEIIAVKRNIIMVEGDDVPCLILDNEFRGPNKDKRRVNLNCCYPTPPQHTYDMDLDTNSFNTSNYSIPNETLMEVAGRKIPKYNVSSEVDASTMLRMHGITLPFYAGGLTEMLCPSYSDLSKELYLFKMWHKTFIDLNEQGSEAATATVAIVVSGCPPHLPPVPCMENKCYGSGLLDVGGDMMARVGLQVLRHM